MMDGEVEILPTIELNPIEEIKISSESAIICRFQRNKVLRRWVREEDECCISLVGRSPSHACGVEVLDKELATEVGKYRPWGPLKFN